ncbi:MAG TPA: DNA repair protein RadA [Rhodothermales bacterium]|nr:DNA repair protein RadA [Rhodothermales bacterium]
MAKARTQYVCQQCGHVSPRWLGQCPDCASWGSFVEEVAAPAAAPKAVAARTAGTSRTGRARTPERLPDVTLAAEHRLMTGLGEFDRVLGGGLLRGAFVLVAGDPGIGKSTLMTQLGALLPNETILYVTGEESPRQVKLRAERLGVSSERFLLLAETNVEDVAHAVQETQPGVLVVDSIQTLFRPDLDSAPGSVAQVRESAATLLHLAKSLELPTFLVGHVTKAGQVAGPRVLEHMVDTVLYFEGDRHHGLRILRATKNRFGSTNEIGVFEMTGEGLREVANPSELFLSERQYGASGSAVVPSLEGSRPLLVEVQALVTPTAYGTPQRTATGFDGRRLQMLLAVLEKRAGMRLSTHDVFVNVAGGVTLDEPAADLGVLVAVASSLRDVPSDSGTVCIGEVGLGGELRGVAQVQPRLVEAARLGFAQAVVPKSSLKGLKAPKGLNVLGVSTLQQALASVLE